MIVEQIDVVLVQLDGLERGFKGRRPIQEEALASDLLQQIAREYIVVLIVIGDENA
jgi:hypothetical protein